jgi:hypothetical protein
MLTEGTPNTNPPERRWWRYGWIVLVLVAAYVGWIVFSRWQGNRSLEERAAEQHSEKEREDAAKTVETLGGTKFDIIAFYIAPGTIHRGESAQMCYGVSEAKDVKLDPPVANVWPSVNRCFDISPKKNTTYTLTAVDSNGNTKTQSVTLEVQ